MGAKGSGIATEAVQDYFGSGSIPALAKHVIFSNSTACSAFRGPVVIVHRCS